MTYSNNDTRGYNETTSKEPQKYAGWYWCCNRKQFYRWNDLMEYLKNDRV